MHEEITTLQDNSTWELVPRQPSMNVVGCRRVYKARLKADRSLERLKARLVAKGFNLVSGVDFSETFSRVIKPATIRIILTVATTKNWPIKQLDVKNVFLHGVLKEPVYMEQPPGFDDPTFSTHVC